MRLVCEVSVDGRQLNHDSDFKHSGFVFDETVQVKLYCRKGGRVAIRALENLMTGMHKAYFKVWNGEGKFFLGLYK